MKKLKESCEDEEIECDFEDKNNTFRWEMFKLKGFRTYTKNNETIKGYWKFKSYQEHFETETPFINEKSDHSEGKCEILVCKDTYILKNEQGRQIEYNPKMNWWIGYVYKKNE